MPFVGRRGLSVCNFEPVVCLAGTAWTLQPWHTIKRIMQGDFRGVSHESACTMD